MNTFRYHKSTLYILTISILYYILCYLSPIALCDDIVYKFVSKKVTYIKHEEVNIMVNDITKLIAVEISELYVFYIKMIREISTDEDLISFIHTRVQNACIDHVSTFNKTLEPSIRK